MLACFDTVGHLPQNIPATLIDYKIKKSLHFLDKASLSICATTIVSVTSIKLKGNANVVAGLF